MSVMPTAALRYRLAPMLGGLLLVVAAGCQTFRLPGLAGAGRGGGDGAVQDVALHTPGQRSFRVSQYLFYADFAIDHRLPLFAELAKLREQVYKELQLPSASNLVHVYLFETRERYQRFMAAKYPNLPRRRAFFVAQPRGVGSAEDLLVYTYWGERIQEDLRHELTHALLHSVLRDVPLWLDEGLAEYFEVPAGWKGVNYNHLHQLRRDSTNLFQPDLARLEKLSEVQQMAPAEYREAWAWVHLMLRTTPEAKRVLTRYLQELRANPSPGLLRPRLVAAVPALDATLVRHLTHLEGNVRPVSAQR